MNLITAITDVNFRSFVTTSVLRTLYVFHLIGTAAMCVVGAWRLSVGTREDALIGVGIIVGSIAALMVTRVAYEFVIVVFRIAEHLGEIDRKTADAADE